MLYPKTRTGRQLAVFDPLMSEYTFVDTCFSAHHLQFAYGEDSILWTSGGGDVVGWLDTNLFLRTGDAEASQGWAPLIPDTNGNEEQDRWTEPGEEADPALDMRVPNGFYAVLPEPRGDAVWGSNAFRYPRSIDLTPENETSLRVSILADRERGQGGRRWHGGGIRRSRSSGS